MENCPITPLLAPAALERLDKEFFAVHSQHIRSCPACTKECWRIVEIQKASMPPAWLTIASQISSVMLLGLHFGFFRRR